MVVVYIERVRTGAGKLFTRLQMSSFAVAAAAAANHC